MQKIFFDACATIFLVGFTGVCGGAGKAPSGPEKVLDRLEKQGQAVRTLQAKVDYLEEQTEVGDVVGRKGRVAFQRENDAVRFLIHFDRLTQDELTTREDVDFAFDGRWFTERRTKAKFIRKIEVVPPGKKRPDLLQLGKGPFPLPFGQKKKDVLTNFKVRLIPPAKGDPPGSDHLLLKPRKGREVARQFVRIEFWVDRKLNLPVRILSEDRGGVITRVDFKNIQTNQPLKNTVFTLPFPSTADRKQWEILVEPYRE